MPGFAACDRPARRAVRLAPLGLLIALLLGGARCAEQGGAPPETTQWLRVSIAGRDFRLAVADTPAQRDRGLSGQSDLGPDEGMLFVFPGERVRRFVMRGCRHPLDLIYLDADGRVISIHEMEPPPAGRPESALKRYTSAAPARYAIEIKGKTAAELGLERGDRIVLPER
jgi:uncharacterized membrane protein (UPF0127 family)